MDVLALQRILRDLGTYKGRLDGIPGPLFRAGVIVGLTIGSDNLLTRQDFIDAAEELGVDEHAVGALYEVESSGKSFIEGRAAILPERHRFSRNTQRRFDISHPDISAPVWDKSWYPRTQGARYEILARMVSLDVDGGFMSCSYGGFQVLGEHWKRLGYTSPWAFAWAHSQSEGDQLYAFVQFIKTDKRLWEALKRRDWATVARLYNGTGYRLNQYDTRLDAAYKRRLRRG